MTRAHVFLAIACIHVCVHVYVVTVGCYASVCTWISAG